MRKIIVHNLMSLDGYYSGLNENVNAIWKYWHKDYANDMSFHFFNIELFECSDMLLLGKKTYQEFFSEHWIKVLKDSKGDYVEQELARHIVPLEKRIVSDNLKDEDLNPENNAKIIRRENVYKTIAELKDKPGKDIIIIGSKTLWQDLLSHDLIDELHLTIAPVISGKGTPMFTYQPEIYLKRIDTRIASGNIKINFKISRTNE